MSDRLSPTMLEALAALAHAPDGEVWYHDVGAGAATAEALLARGLAQEARAVECNTHGKGWHAGYLEITERGRFILSGRPWYSARNHTAADAASR